MVIMILGRRCPYLSLHFLLTWHALHDFVIDQIEVRMPFQYIVAFIVSSRWVCPGCLLWVLQETKKMFNGTLGIYPHKKVHIDIDPNAKPVHSGPYPVPWIHVKAFKMELNHPVRIGVLTPQQER